MPHLWHVGEWVLTFVAEILAPLAAMFLGRRGRWFAFWSWLALQAGIQLTCNFGWLNTASIGLGLLLFDDQMLAGAASRLRLDRLARFLADRAAKQIVPPRAAAWRRYGLATALWVHFYLSIIVFWDVTQIAKPAVVEAVAQPLKYAFDGLGSVNAFKLYSRFDPFHCVAEFVGSNDGGQTWRAYEFRYFPQQLDRIPPFLAPRFPRFEATLQILVATRSEPSAFYGIVAGHLLAQNPEVLRLFANNPFPDRPPQMIRMPGYQYKFTDYATYQQTGHHWERTYLGEYMPMMFVSPKGEITQTFSELEQVTVKANYGNPTAQSYLGFLHVSGEEGVEKNPAEAVKWFRRAAEQGLAEAQFNLALILADGDGVPQDAAQAAYWCRLAAEQGFANSAFRLGQIYEKGSGVGADRARALAWYKKAAERNHAQARIEVARLEGKPAPNSVTLQAEAAKLLQEPAVREWQNLSLTHMVDRRCRFFHDATSEAHGRQAADAEARLRAKTERAESLAEIERATLALANGMACDVKARGLVESVRKRVADQAWRKGADH